MSINPVIIIPGIGQSKVDLTDSAGNKVKSAWPFELNEQKLLDEIKGPLMKMMILRKDGGFSDKVASIVKSLTDPLAVNSDGTKRHSAKAVSYSCPLSQCAEQDKKYIYKMVPVEPLSEKIGEENVFFFAFDPFGDIFDTAAELDSFVSSVKEQTAGEKVDILCISIGGAILKAYLAKYADKGDLGKIVNFAAALDGTSLIADLFEDKLNLENPIETLKSFGGKAEKFSSMAAMLPQDIMATTISKSMAAAKNDILLSCTTMWALIPNSRFESIFNRILSGGDPVLKEKVTEYYNYSKDFGNKAKELAESGVEFFQICGFGRDFLSIFATGGVSSDGIIDASSASLYSESLTLGAEPEAAKCLFPKTTWFFKNQKHSEAAYNDVALRLAVEILTGGVASSDECPYPMINNSRNIKALKYNLIPKAKKLLDTARGETKATLTDCIGRYEEIISATVVADDSDVKALEAQLNSIVGA